MKHRLLLIFLIALLPALAVADDVIVTRNFTGLWDQPRHESQGINLQIVAQATGEKVGVAYWFTYGDDMQSAWFVGIGPVSDNRIDMILYEASEIGFLQPSQPGNDGVKAVGGLVMEFSSCDEGVVAFDTDIASIGSGTFPVERISTLHNTRCSGGISDDTRANVLTNEQRIALVPTPAGGLASGHADFEERPDRTEFSVEAEDLADGSYRIVVGGVDRGELVVSLGVGETEFRSPVEAGKVLLTFDPRGQEIEVHDDMGAVLTSGDAVFDGGGDDGGGGTGGGGDDGGGTGGGGDDGGGTGGGGDDGGGAGGGGDGGGGDDMDFGDAELEVELSNTGVFPAASGDAKLRPRADRTDFSVEIEDVPVGNYGLSVGGVSVGTIQAVRRADGTVEGELEFRNPVEPGKQLLDFDPRGQQIDVTDGATVILETRFPTG